jgi:CelD/BcsL family acetyltransferase involved in cellulose biosynthesis
MLAVKWQDYKYHIVQAVNTRGLAAAWADLIEKSAQPAGFNAPELLFPILKHKVACKLAIVDHGSEMFFALPLVETPTHFKSLWSPLIASSLPHISSNKIEAVMQAVLHGQTKPLLLNAIPSDGPFFENLKNHAAQFEVIETWQRAALKPTGTFEKWFEQNFDNKRRKEFKRLRNRLAELGKVETVTLKKGDNVRLFLKDLLALEAAGWKGKKGTAINSVRPLADSMYEAIVELHQAGKLRFWSLKLKDKCIASLFAIVEGNQAWLGKIAYDEAYAKYSPGVMIIFDCTESFFADSKIECVDSSAIPNHPMIDRIWRDRIGMVSVAVAPASISTLNFKLVVGFIKWKLHMRNKLRDAYYRIRGEKRS